MSKPLSNRPSATSDTWIDVDRWAFIQQHMPIACVDVLPIKRDSGSITSIGLIRRETPDEGQRWCLIGGRLFRNEAIADAILRQIQETLGDAVDVKRPLSEQPDFVIQYFTTPRIRGGLDSRQHAIGLTYCVSLSGTCHPQGEARDFAWFAIDKLPNSGNFGFGQYPHIAAYLGHENGRTSTRIDEHVEAAV